jgi:hypothetical protein
MRMKERSTHLPAGAARAAERLATPLALLAAACGVLLVLANTHLGAYLSDDSYYYIHPAREALAGRGFHPSYIFAPLFPLALAFIGLTGLDALDAARWLNAALFGANIFLIYRLVCQMGGRPGFGLLAAGLVLLSDVTVEIHGWVMSEALSLTLTLACLSFILAWCAGGRRRYWWAAALAAALAVLARYAALPLVGGAALTLLCFGPVERQAGRVKEAVSFGAASLLPIAAYWLRNQAVSGRPVRYEQYLFVPFTRDQLAWFLYHWLSLFVPGRLLRGREILAGGLAVLACAVVAAAAWRAYGARWARLGDRRVKTGLFMLSATLALNLLMLFLARGLTGLDVFNPRYLVPPLVLFLMLLALLASQVWQAAGRTVRLGLAGLVTLFLLYYGYRTVDFSRQMMRAGLGYANVGWHQSETVAYIRAHPELGEQQMVSTGEMGIYFWTGRKPEVPNTFGSPAGLRDHLCQTGAVLFIMDQMPIEIYGMARAEVEAILALDQDFNDSDLYRCPPGR